MDDYELTFLGSLIVTPSYEGEVYDESEEIEKVFDGAMAELVKLDDAIDPILSGSIEEATIEISLTVEADTLPGAVERADAIVRTCLHTAGVSTKDWPAEGHLSVDFHHVDIDDPTSAQEEPAEGDEADSGDLVSA